MWYFKFLRNLPKNGNNGVAIRKIVEAENADEAHERLSGALGEDEILVSKLHGPYGTKADAERNHPYLP